MNADEFAEAWAKAKKERDDALAELTDSTGRILDHDAYEAVKASWATRKALLLAKQPKTEE